MSDPLLHETAIGSRVVVVGAGPAGALVAALLARRGLAVTLLERATDFSREFRGEILMPSGQAIFDQIGMTEAFDALPSRVFAGAVLYRGGKRLFEIDFTDGLGGPPPRAVHQPALLEMLADEGRRQPGYEILMGARVTDLVTTAGRVSGVTFEQDGGTRTRPADLVIAADGRFSVIRRAAGLPDARRPQAFDVVWCKIPTPSGWGERGRIYLGGGHFALVLPTYDGRLQVGWIIEKGSYGELSRAGIEGWLGALAEHVDPELASHLASVGSDAIDPFLLSVVCDALERWTAPGLLLLGDAAHPMSPVGGQGLNIALRDAVVADNHLGPVLSGGGADAVTAAAIDAAAHAVVAERRPETDAIQKLQRRMPGLLFAGGWRARFVVDVALPFLVRTGLARRMFRSVFERLAHGVTEVRYHGLGRGLDSPP